MTAHGRYAAPFLAGLLSHLVYFQRGEHHLYVVSYIGCFLTAVGFIVWFLNSRGEDLLPSLIEALRLGACFLTGIYSSVIPYRLFWSPLNHFPGAFGAKISNFWLPYTLRASDSFRQYERLHAKYGPFLRLGPDFLSIAHPKAVKLVHGAGSKCTKAALYDITWPSVSLQSTRIKSFHDERRRVWSAAFSDKALRGYEQRLHKYRQNLIQYLTSLDGKPVNVTKWFNMYSYDFMGDLAFGKSFGLLESHDYSAIQLFNNAFSPLGFGFSAWFFVLLTAIPGLAGDWWKFLDFCGYHIERRLKNPADLPDITSALEAPLKGKEPTRKDWDLLRGDSQLIVVAGSDTTASTLTAIMYELLRNPRHIEILRQELEPHMDSSGEVLNEKIANLNHLNGVINESLRLHPVIPTTMQRKTPPEGITIDGTFIPGNTTITCPQYVIGRSEDAYQNPTEFIPERWSTRPDLIKEKDAFAPFSIGPYNCLGKHLALLNIRTTLARLVTTYEISLAPGDDGEGFVNNAKDAFVVSHGGLMLSFRERT